MHLVGASLVWRAKADHCLTVDHGRLVALLSFLDGRSDGSLVVAINADGVPVAGFEACVLVGGVGDADIAIDGDVVVVPQQNKLV